MARTDFYSGYHRAPESSNFCLCTARIGCGIATGAIAGFIVATTVVLSCAFLITVGFVAATAFGEHQNAWRNAKGVLKVWYGSCMLIGGFLGGVAGLIINQKNLKR